MTTIQDEDLAATLAAAATAGHENPPGAEDPPPTAPDPEPEPVEGPSELEELTGGEIVPAQQFRPLSSIPDRHEFEAIAAQAMVYAAGNLVPDALRGKPEDVFLILMTGRDLGVAPTACLRKMYVVDGNVTIAPQLKGALIRMNGAGRYWFPRPPDADGVFPDPDPPNDATTAVVYGQRTGEDYIQRSEFTMEEASRITFRTRNGEKRLVDKDNWRNYPRRMLQWRALTYLIDDLWPEVGFGLYTPDEMGADTDEDGRLTDVRAVDVPAGFERAHRFARQGASDSAGEQPYPGIEDLKARIGRLSDGAKAELRKRWDQKLTYADDTPVPLKGLTRRSGSLAAALVSGVESEDRNHRYGPYDDQEATSGHQGDDQQSAEDAVVICGACGEQEQQDGSCACAPDDATAGAGPVQEDLAALGEEPF